MSQSLFDITDKIIVVTGGAGVLGSSMAAYLLTVGAKVALIGRTTKKIEAKVAELKKSNPSILGLTGDVLSEEDMEHAKNKVESKWGKIDALINAAGGNMPGATIGQDQTIFDLKMEDFRKVSQLNLDGSVIPSLVFGKAMSKNGSGCIINISSMTASQAVTRVVGYSTSKAAIDNFTRWMATELALKFGDTFRVNAIAPGFFISNQNRTLLTNEDGSYTERGNTIIAKTPMKRFGEAEELNGSVHWLLSEAATFVTGTIIPIDGGFSAFSGV